MLRQHGRKGWVNLRQFFVREPSPRIGDGIVTYIERTPVDYRRALQQWTNYVEVVQAAGWQPILLPSAASCPDSVFVEDPVVVYQNVAVVTRPSVASRRPEIFGIGESAKSLGYVVHRIEAPGTLEGGDVLAVHRDIYVGQGGRSNAEGIEQLRKILEPMGAKVFAVPMGPALHLKSAVTALPDDSFIGYLPALSDPGLFPKLHAVPELQGSNVVLLGGDQVLIAANCPKSAALIHDLGFDVVPVDISEFQKVEGDVTCLSVRLT
jgi:dimethylargininase